MLNLRSLLRKLLAIILVFLHAIPTTACIANPLIGMLAPIGFEWFLLSPWNPLMWSAQTKWLVLDMISIPNLYDINPNPIVGWSLFAIGLFIFVVAFVQFFSRRKKGFVTTGLYSKVRHPQYLGIILATAGFTFLSERPIAWISWLNLTFLYLLLASFEEKIIQKNYGEQFQAYRQQVPFILPFVRFPIPKSRPRKYITILLIYITTMITSWIILKQFSYHPGPFF